MKPVAIIPARYASKRLPGKLMLKKDNKYLIQIVYEKVKQSDLFARVIIAADTKRIYNCAIKFGADACLTARSHQSGTDRVAEVAAKIKNDYVVNIQGDEPEISFEHLELICKLIKQKGVKMATLAVPISKKKEFKDPNVVKVVMNENGNALYFSRALIPFDRDNSAHQVYKHIGLYAYKRKFLLQFSTLRQTLLEQTEKLEQLRALEYGFDIKVGITQKDIQSIDTLQDWKRFLKL